ncbi:hypothetical protein [Lichenifustis flavocetrariae]|uniref:Uncharacterized protein n=1 Tax=Lichenifustis flavocetrariae TaxID=2949735 RepID=A0AA41YTB3_9HYPH|nr:hypothetical protein [Lichenifustis flavocetrariae]MCW6508204.1 hypothetical protein [Lichenifustis flavocetrariae]
MSADPYRAFLESKIKRAPVSGFDVNPASLSSHLKPFNTAIVRCALQGGRRAIFTKFGLHKTRMQIEIMHQIGIHAGGRQLIIAPLGVRQEFLRDAAVMGISIRFVRSAAEVSETGIHLTKYKTVRDGKLEPNLFEAASLDEASVLRSFGSKTYQTFLTLFQNVRYRFVATATPSPNRFKELIHYAGFLGVMDTGQALTRFFQRNAEKAGDLTLYPPQGR